MLLIATVLGMKQDISNTGWTYKQRGRSKEQNSCTRRPYMARILKGAVTHLNAQGMQG